MTEALTIALAQLNPTVGDLEGNVELVRAARQAAAAEGADLVVAPELVVSGYPPEDLVLKPAFQDRIEALVGDLAAETGDGGPALLLGTPWRREGRLYNAAVLLDGGKVAALSLKTDLPNYGVFDEKRVFSVGPQPQPVAFRGVSLGVLICEDVWTQAPVDALTAAGAEILVVLNGSPFEAAKFSERVGLMAERIQGNGRPLIYVNQVGGQDELVFDGASFVLNGDGARAVQAPAWQSTVVATAWQRGQGGWHCAEGAIEEPPEGLESVYQAMVAGLRDYVDKNGFPGVVLGLSGGIDSALSAAVAADALGPGRVRCIMLPSVYTSEESLIDAAECARLMGARLEEIPIVPGVAALHDMLTAAFAGRAPDITEENIQARLRGLVLMALSNKFGDMVLTTGNKSEMSVGYATLYGDMCGGYSVLKDVYKTMVFALSRWRNQHHPAGGLGPQGRVIPERIITKPPSAELRPDQTDQDSLPEYEALDDILGCLIEAEMALPEIVARGHDEATVRRIEHLLYIAEYKRRQSPPGVKITRRNFGRDRRYPITNRFRDRGG
ncbi:MAG: NAD+ synthase [Alphaproteobacteria bacterium]|jgi:NAD+ synthase|nr:NAD+ synthase [Alphaproteobacteria bacterium]